MDRIPYKEGDKAPDGYTLAKDANTGAKFWAKMSEIRPGPIRHDNIDEILPVIRWVYRHLGQYMIWCRTFEDWELGFLRDQKPGKEARYWEKMTRAFLEFCHQKPKVNPKKVAHGIFQLGGGLEPEGLKDQHVQLLKDLYVATGDVTGQINNFSEDGYLDTDVEYLR